MLVEKLQVGWCSTFFKPDPAALWVKTSKENILRNPIFLLIAILFAACGGEQTYSTTVSAARPGPGGPGDRPPQEPPPPV